MKLCRYNNDRLGLIEDGEVRDVSAALDALPPRRWPYPIGDALVENLDAVRRRVSALASKASPIPVGNVKLCSPVANPGKIIGAPANYRAHIDEAKADASIHHGVHDKGYDPESPIAKLGLFLKATSSLVGVSDGVILHAPDKRNDHEVEICAVIGITAKHVPRERALEVVAGYSLGLDMTVRGGEDRSFRKSPDTYSVVGPWLVTADEMPSLSEVTFGLSVNGEHRQRARARDMIADLPTLIEIASANYTLHPGDIIMTGTPEGVGPIRPGDVLHIWCDGIGACDVAVKAS